MSRIPKILHYAFGFSADFGGKPWSLVHHVCVASAVQRLRPDAVFLYYEFEPSGSWWHLTKPLVTPVKVAAPREVFGIPLEHVAHRADVFRLQTLLTKGGIYLDSDVLVHKRFDDLLDNSVVLGMEGQDALYGLCNAVILSEPGAPFIERWFDAYRSFRGQGSERYWNEHSVQLPAALARAHPSEITVLPYTSFHWPLWTPEHLAWMYASADPVPLTHTYANHLWESKAQEYLENLTPGSVRSKESNFNLWARPFLADLPDDFEAAPLAKRVLSSSRKLGKRGRRLAFSVKRRIREIGGDGLRAFMSQGTWRRRVFQKVYERGAWGSDGESRFYSGVGSAGPAAAVYIDRMAELLAAHAREIGRPFTIVDIGCGDFRVGSGLLDRLPDFRYIGCDIVPELIEYNASHYSNDRVTFQALDAVRDTLPPGEVCLIRQVLQHLPNADILRILRRLRYPFVYVTEGHPVQRIGPINPDKRAGSDVRFDWVNGRGRGVELDLPPFNFRVTEVFRSLNALEVIVTELVMAGGLSEIETSLEPSTFDRRGS